MYFVERPFPIFCINLFLTKFPSTISTVVGLISGNFSHISYFDIGWLEFNINDLILFCFDSLFPDMIVKRLSNSL